MSFEVQPQDESHWCWAAVAASIRQYFEPGHALTQCQIASKVLGEKCCAEPAEHDKPAKLQDGLDFVGRRGGGQKGPPPFLKLKTEIDLERPVCVRIAWKDGGAHFVVIYGYKQLRSGLQTIEVADPHYGKSTRNLALFPEYYHGGGAWTYTFFTR